MPEVGNTQVVPQQRFIYTMEYYSAIKNNDFMKSVGKCMELDTITEYYILEKIFKKQKNQ